MKGYIKVVSNLEDIKGAQEMGIDVPEPTYISTRLDFHLDSVSFCYICPLSKDRDIILTICGERRRFLYDDVLLRTVRNFLTPNYNHDE